MRILIIFFISFVLLFSCDHNPKRVVNYPSLKYHYSDIQSDQMVLNATTYVPVYSDIYHMDGSRRFLLTATLSVRNTSMTDSMYVFEIDYYDSHGALIRNYIDSTLVLGPLESSEFVVEENENISGAGANFIVKWGGIQEITDPVMQAIMIGTYAQQGLSFTTDGVEIYRSIKK